MICIGQARWRAISAVKAQFFCQKFDSDSGDLHVLSNKQNDHPAHTDIASFRRRPAGKIEAVRASPWSDTVALDKESQSLIR